MGLITRGEAAKRLGISITTFRRKFEGDLAIKPEVVDPTTGKALFKPEVIEEIVEENYPALTPEQMAANNLREMGSIAVDGLHAGIDAVVKTADVQQKSRDALEREVTRLTARVIQLEESSDKLRRENQLMLDEAHKKAREDRVAELELRQKEETHKHAMTALHHMVPAGMALFGKIMGLPPLAMAGASQDALSKVFGGMGKERVAALSSEIMSSQSLTMEEKFSLAAAIEALKPKEDKPASSEAPKSIDERAKDVAARLKQAMADAEKLEAEQAELAKTNPEKINGAAPPAGTAAA